jgi:hypothetical protein
MGVGDDPHQVPDQGQHPENRKEPLKQSPLAIKPDDSASLSANPEETFFDWHIDNQNGSFSSPPTIIS